MHIKNLIPELILVSVGFASAQAIAVDGANIDGLHGELHVHGTLTESACRLDMTSAWQDIDIGNTATGQLSKIGATGRPVSVTFRLQDCISEPSRLRDMRSGNLLWSPDEPSVTIRFTAQADRDNPSLIALHGVSGLALRMQDSQERDVRINENGAPLLLVPGRNELHYTLTPVRTAETLLAGAWSGRITLGLSYD